MELTLSLDDSDEIRGTFFDGLIVRVHDDDFRAMLDEMFHAHRENVDSPRTAWASKRYVFPDRRYNPVSEAWPLDELIERLDQIHSFGIPPLPQPEDYGSFKVHRPRGFDALGTRRSQAVYLNDWPYEPLYRVEQFGLLTAALAGLRDIAAYIQTNNSEQS